MKTEELKLTSEWGDKAHSYYFGKDAYDNLDVIPFDKIQKFMKENGVG